MEQSQTVKVKEKGKGGKITKGNLMSLAKGSEASGIAKNIAKSTKRMAQIEKRKEEAKKNSKVFVENEESWGKETMESFLQGTAEYKVNENAVKEKGEGEYFNYKYLNWRNKEEIYQLFRQNSYFGELMADAMGMDFKAMQYMKEE